MQQSNVLLINSVMLSGKLILVLMANQFYTNLVMQKLLELMMIVVTKER